VKFVPLILRGLLRKKLRSTLTVLSVAICIFLWTAIAAVQHSFAVIEEGASAELRLGVFQKYVGAWKSEMPRSYVEEVRRMSVGDVVGIRFIGGFARKDDFIFGYAISNPADFLRVYQELDDPRAVARDRWDAFSATQSAALMGRRALLKRGWKVGQEVEIETWGNLPHLKFKLAGVIDQDLFADAFVMHLDRLEKLLRQENIVDLVKLRLRSVAEMDRVSRQIETHFERMPVQVTSRTEKAEIRDWLGEIGDLRYTVTIVGLVVLLAAGLLTLNSLSLSLRERAAEIGLLRALGFSGARIFGLLASEAGLLTLLAGAVGAGGAWAIFTFFPPPVPIGFQDSVRIPAGVAVLSTVVALGIGVVAVAIPTAIALRRPVADVLRQAA
jgi:putative ABC transport system permease protein